MVTDAANKSPPTGIPVDASGGATIDPTANVLQLVEAAVERLDDLRASENKRLDDLRAAESRRVDGEAALRAHYDGLLAAAEAKRIDAIRAVDVAAVAVASERATQQAQVLANQVSTSADALRALVATTATAMAQAQTTLTQQFNDRIALLEKASYEGKGRSAYTDPAMTEMSATLTALLKNQSQQTGKSEGISTTWAVVIAGITMAVALFGGGLLRQSSSQAPQIVYVPPPGSAAVSPTPAPK